MSSMNPIPLNIRPLTSLRFFAAIWVVLLHYRSRMGYVDIQRMDFFNNAYLAVDFFFVLSGFIMAHVYIESIVDSKFSVFDFLKKRFSRLYPLHIFVLTVYVALFGIFSIFGFESETPEKYNFYTLPANILMVHAWGTIDNLVFNYPSWSISAEWFAYLVFFPVSLIIIKLRKYPVILFINAILLLTGFYYLVPYTGIVDNELTKLSFDFGIFRIFPEFILGISTYILCKKIDIGEQASRIMLFTGILILLILVHFDINDLIFIALFTSIIFSAAALSRNENAVGWLGKPSLVYLGDISYSVYMVHAIFFSVYFRSVDIIIGKQISPILMLLIWSVGVVGTVVLATITYRFIEIPGRSFLNGWLLKKPIRFTPAVKGILYPSDRNSDSETH